MVLARATGQCVHGFKVQSLATVSWAFATGGSSETQLLQALSSAAWWRMADFKAQELANTAWSLAVAMAGPSHAQLFMTFARRAQQCLGSFKLQELPNTV
eukprot:gnl/MRDRNA2_/MRDRNA2_80285_c0_seq3.p1 gnl/MRDRNA2_/MRDRNA2_80285_c0~~gnl/MRDRNA2_/MRDRNA2_80285_c0_seq3.p1  ORF type:complete len:100 (-),score=18.51 gnl/MRDRNA2_/MRDRNA2_80285_c0_seq3:287-586(-)